MGSNIDLLLVVLWFLPVTLAVVLESPLKWVVSSLLQRKKKQSAGAAAREEVHVTITNEPSSASHKDPDQDQSTSSQGASASGSKTIDAQRSFLAKEEAHWRDHDVPESPSDEPTSPRSLSIGQRSGCDL